MKQSLHFFLVLALLLLSTFSVFADDWPQWRGPNRDGMSVEKNLLQTWPQSGPQLLWQLTDLGNGYSTPAVQGNRVFVIANEGMEDEFVKAMNVADGSEIWSTRIGKVGKPDQRPSFPGSRTTPTVEGTFLYALGSDGDFVCLETATGKIVWQKHLVNNFAGASGRWAYSESPLVDGDKVICSPGGADASIIALDKKDGRLIWKSAVLGCEAAGYASPIKATIAGVEQYVTFLANGLVGVNSNTGEFLWLYGEINDSANMATPVVFGDYVYDATRRKGNALVKIIAESDSMRAKEIYKESLLPSAIGGFILMDGYLYGCNGKAMMCVDLLSGDVVWQQASIAPAALCYADGCFYLHGENGDVALIQASNKEYKELGCFAPADQPAKENGMERAWTYPVVANGKLYIRDQNCLWCYKISK